MTRAKVLAGFLLVVGCLALLTGTSWAESRPITPTSPSPDGAGTDLQSLLNAIYGPGVVDATAGQLNTPLFQALPPGFPLIGIQMAFEFTGNASTEGFGIYEAGNPANSALLFPGSAIPGDISIVTFSPSLLGNTIAFLPFASGTGAFITTFSAISASAFGVFISGPGTSGGASGLFTSEDQFNPGGLAQILTYFYDGETTFAAEDLQRYGGISDGDFNDLILTAQSIRPIPEPGSIALLGGALILLGGLVRLRLRHSN